MDERVNDVERLAGRVAAIEQRLDGQDDQRFGSTAWLIREVRTVALMTAYEGMATLRILLDQYDKKQREERRLDTPSNAG